MIIAKYNVDVVLVNPENKEETYCRRYEVRFNYDEDNYGNGTYMWFGDNLYDLRYNTYYHEDEQAQFVCDYCFSHWTGRNGSWVLKKFSIEVIDET